MFTVRLHYDSPKKRFAEITVQAWAEDWVQELGGGTFTSAVRGPEATVTLTLAGVQLDKVERTIAAWNRHHTDITAIVS